MFTIYSKENCAYCTRAKQLITTHGFNYTELLLGRDLSREDFMSKFPNTKTVPLIFFKEKRIGTYEDLDIWMENVYNAYGESDLGKNRF